MLIYAAKVKSIETAIFMPTVDAFRGWGMYLKLSIPSMLMYCPEWWSFEILIIMAGYIGVNEQAVLTIHFNILCTMWMLALGF